MDKLCSVWIEGADSYLPCDFMIENVPLKDIAHQTQGEVERKFELSYRDVLDSFWLSKDVYTEEHHLNLIASALTSLVPFVRLSDAVSVSIRNREFIQSAELSPYTKCNIAFDGHPIHNHDLNLFLGNTASQSTYTANSENLEWLEYLISGLKLDGEELISPASALTMIGALIFDKDRERARDIEQYFMSKGCADIERNKSCIEKILSKKDKEDKKEVIHDPVCSNISEDINCFTEKMRSVITEFYFRMPSVHGVPAYRQTHPTITQTTFVRAALLHGAIEKISKTPGLVSQAPKNILIVGPGLEKINQFLSIDAPRQTYEPFAVAAGAVEFLGTKPDQMSLTLVDINDKVLKHIENAVAGAEKNEPYTIFLASNSTAKNEGNDFEIFNKLPGTTFLPLQMQNIAQSTRISISPEIVKRMHPVEGNIAANRLGDDSTYDMVVMRYVFMYLSPAEKFIALNNIKRLLKPGGILITDITEDELFDRQNCAALKNDDFGVVAEFQPTADEVDNGDRIPTGNLAPFVIWKKK